MSIEGSGAAAAAVSAIGTPPEPRPQLTSVGLKGDDTVQ